jgi:hypothetical protein
MIEAQSVVISAMANPDYGRELSTDKDQCVKART